MKKKSFLYLKILLGVSILLLLFYKVGLKNIYANFTNFNFVFLAPILIIEAVIFSISALNPLILTKPLKKNVGFWRMLKYTTLSFSLGSFLPGRIGEFSLVHFLKKEKINLGQGSVVFILNQMITFLVLSVLAVVGFFTFLPASRGASLLVVLVLFFSAGIFFIFSKWGNSFIKKFLLRGFSKKFKGFSRTYSDLIYNHKRELLFNFILTCLKTSLDALIVFILFLSFRVQAPFIFVLIITAAIRITSLIPITINGLGIRESLGVFFYGLLNIESSLVASVYILLLVLRYLIALTFIIVFFDRKLISKSPVGI